jgi:N-acyl homoserine lactone hydrolase
MHKIIPLNVGTFDALPKQTCMYRMYREVTYEAPCVMWHIAGTKDSIVVDLGPPDPAQVLAGHGFPMRRTPEQQPLSALAKAGVDPKDVRTIIITHLHWDHAWGFDLFENARFVIQKREVEYAVAPFPCHRSLYYEQSIGKPRFVDYLDRITVIDGDFTVVPGVEAVFLPGHTPGFQGIAVDTENGRHLIAGDAVGLYECMETDPYVPSGLYNDLEEYYQSLERIRQIAKVVLPGHDARIFEKSTYP